MVGGRNQALVGCAYMYDSMCGTMDASGTGTYTFSMGEE